MREQSKSVIEANPTTQSVQLDGTWINIAAVSRETGMDQGYLSRVFSGQRTPSMFRAQAIADVLGFELERFVNAIKERRNALQSTSRD